MPVERCFQKVHDSDTKCTVRDLIISSKEEEIRNFLCVCCNLLLLDPHQCTEGKRICKEHLKSEYFEGRLCYPDRAAKVEMEDKLKAICPHCLVFSNSVLEVLRHIDHCEKLVLMTDGVASSTKDLQVQLEEYQKRIQILEKQNVNLADEVKQLKVTIANMDLDFKHLENVTYDGIYIWKIDRFSKRSLEALTGKITALHSAPLYTSRFGYRFCLKVYLNGDGMGKCSHISLFFVLMHSEYDDLLDFPFSKEVTFTLIHPKNPELNVIKSFIPDKHSASVMKPKKEMNIPMGCPQFVTKEKLKRDFIFYDSIYLKVEVRDQKKVSNKKKKSSYNLFSDLEYKYLTEISNLLDYSKNGGVGWKELAQIHDLDSNAIQCLELSFDRRESPSLNLLSVASKKA